MWNPNRYQDTDFGLRETERFEPDDSGDDEAIPGPGEPYIQTVLGPISPEDAGVTLVHEQLIAAHGQAPGDYRMDDPNAALIDLETFFTVGGRTIVDTSASWEGRSVATLVWLAQRAPVHLIASTGIDLRAGDVDSNALLEVQRDAYEGIDDSGARAGMLKVELAIQHDQSGDPSIVTCIGESQRRTGLPVMLRSSTGAVNADLVSAVIETGIAPERLIMSGQWEASDDSRLEILASFGTLLLFDGLGDGRRGGDGESATVIAELIHAGHRDQILLSHGFNRRSLRTGYDGRPGYGYIIEEFAIMLLEAGVAATDVRAMLVDNCASALTIHPTESEVDARPSRR